MTNVLMQSSIFKCNIESRNVELAAAATDITNKILIQDYN